MNSNEQPNSQSDSQGPGQPNLDAEQFAENFPFGKHRRRHFFWKLPLVLIFVAAKVGAVMLLWNYLAPDLFHLPTLDYLHAFGLVVLCKLLFGFGFGRPGWGGGGMGMGFNRMHKRWHGMSHEERQKLREALRKRWEA